MRISDWSSDVCSSDLARQAGVQGKELARPRRGGAGRARRRGGGECALGGGDPLCDREHRRGAGGAGGGGPNLLQASGDRKSVVSGKSVAVSVDLGGCRLVQ